MLCAVGVLFLCLLAPTRVPGAGPDAPPASYAFARYLLEKGYGEEAAAEFRRFCFLHPEHALVPEAMLRIGECYEAEGDFAGAAARYREAARLHAGTPAGDEALLRAGEAAYRGGQYEEARIVLQRFLERGPAQEEACRARYRLAWTSLRLHAFVLARQQFEALASTGSPFGEPSAAIVAGIDRIPALPHRSPVAAGLLSALLPGSGHLYAGAPKDALLAFLVNGALIFATYEAFDEEVYAAGGLVSVVTLTFYLGNVYGAVNSAHHANRERLNGLLRHYETLYEDFTGQGPPPGGR